MNAHSFATGVVAALVLSWAMPSSAAVVSKVSYKEETAEAFFYDEEAITCDDGSAGRLETNVTLIAFDSAQRGGGNSRVQEVWASLSRYNTCTGVGDGAFTIVRPTDYRQTRTDSAVLTATVEFVGEGGEALGSLDAALVFTGVGDTTRGSFHSSYQSGEYTYKSRWRGEWRPAQVSGSVTLDGEELIDNLQQARLGNTQAGDMTIQR